MTFLGKVSPVLLTWNEEPNIGRVVGRLGWAREVVVVDSGSTDRTVPILQTFPNVRVITRPFSTHADQWNHALAEAGALTEWVLCLDADYVLSEGLIAELGSLEPPSHLVGYTVHFVYWALGRPLRGSLYPPKVVLLRKEHCRFVQDGHTQRPVVDGPVGRLLQPIHHDDRKDLSRWLSAQAAYADLEVARDSRGRGWRGYRHLLRRAGVTPPLVALYALLVRGALLDGRPGLYYATQRAVAEALIVLKLWGHR